LGGIAALLRFGI